MNRLEGNIMIGEPKMFQLFDEVKLKVGDKDSNVSPEQVGVIVDIVKSKDGTYAYTVEFMDDNVGTNMSALLKYYLAEELIKVD